MAAALLDHHAQGQVNPAVIAALAEIGVDVTKEFPKPLTDEVARAADVIVTMGCGDACPVYPGKRYLDWQLPDPAGRPIEDIRPIRDAINQRVQQLLAETTSLLRTFSRGLVGSCWESHCFQPPACQIGRRSRAMWGFQPSASVMARSDRVSMRLTGSSR